MKYAKALMVSAANVLQLQNLLISVATATIHRESIKVGDSCVVNVLTLSGESEKTQMSSTPTHQFQCWCCSHKHLVFYPEGNAGFRWKISMGKHSSWVD